MRIFRVVLTGGPHAGKTGTFEAIKAHLKSQAEVDKLIELGVQEGDKVRILDFIFEYR